MYCYTTCSLMKFFEKKTRLELHKDAACCFKQILEAAPYKTVGIWPLTSHLINYPKKGNHDMLDTAGKVRTNLLAIFSYRHTSVSQPAKTYSSALGAI